MSKETNMPDKKKIIRIRNIPVEIHEELKIRAIREGVSMEALVLRWIEEKLKK
jgi:plasmid stability protein